MTEPAEGTLRDALVKIKAALDERSCACGAEIGDSIDRTWHLVNQAISEARR